MKLLIDEVRQEQGMLIVLVAKKKFVPENMKNAQKLNLSKGDIVIPIEGDKLQTRYGDVLCPLRESANPR